MRQLPDEFADALQRGDALSNGAARRMLLEEFVRRIAEREGVTPDEAHAQARADVRELRAACRSASSTTSSLNCRATMPRSRRARDHAAAA